MFRGLMTGFKYSGGARLFDTPLVCLLVCVLLMIASPPVSAQSTAGCGDSNCGSGGTGGGSASGTKGGTGEVCIYGKEGEVLRLLRCYLPGGTPKSSGANASGGQVNDPGAQINNAIDAIANVLRGSNNSDNSNGSMDTTADSNSSGDSDAEAAAAEAVAREAAAENERAMEEAGRVAADEERRMEAAAVEKLNQDAASDNSQTVLAIDQQIYQDTQVENDNDSVAQAISNQTSNPPSSPQPTVPQDPNLSSAYQQSSNSPDPSDISTQLDDPLNSSITGLPSSITQRLSDGLDGLVSSSQSTLASWLNSPVGQALQWLHENSDITTVPLPEASDTPDQATEKVYRQAVIGFLDLVKGWFKSPKEYREAIQKYGEKMVKQAEGILNYGFVQEGLAQGDSSGS